MYEHLLFIIENYGRGRQIEYTHLKDYMFMFKISKILNDTGTFRGK